MTAGTISSGRLFMVTSAWSGDGEADRQRDADDQAVDGERSQAVGLEEPKQETDGDVGGERRSEGSHERLSTHVVALRTEQLGQLERGGRADNRRREQEREAGGVLVR